MRKRKHSVSRTRRLTFETCEARQLFTAVASIDLETLDRQPIASSLPAPIQASLLRTPSGESPKSFTWSVERDGAKVTGHTGGSDLQAALGLAFGHESVWMKAIEDAFSQWSRIAAVTFTHVQPGTAGAIRIVGHSVDGPGNVLATAILGSSPEIVIDTDFGQGSQFLSGLSATLIHEIGHILGLGHRVVSAGQTIMQENFDKEILVPQFDDKVSIQSLFGDALEPNDGREQGTSLETLVFGSTNREDLSLHGPNDEDYFRFRAKQGQSLSVRVVPVGAKYKRGNSDDGLGTLQEFDALRQQQLRIEVGDQSGAILPRLSEVRPIGESIHLLEFQIPADGEYYVRVFGVAPGGIQMYRAIFDVSHTSASDPRNTLRDWSAVRALASAPRDPQQPFTINLESGTYQVTEPLRVSGHLIIKGTGISDTVLNGMHQNRIFELLEGSTLELEGATLHNGKDNRGGAIYGYQGNLKLFNVHFIDNESELDGGAVHISTGSLTATRVVAQFNRAARGGGAFYILDSKATIADSLIEGNVADNHGGGVVAYADVKIHNSVFKDNRAGPLLQSPDASGGGGGLDFGSGHRLTANLEVTRSSFFGNTSGYGGGMSLGEARVVLDGIHIEGNRAYATGGGIRWAGKENTFLMKDSFVVGNFANSSAGLSLDNSRESVEVRRSWIRGNQASSTSGGVGIGSNVENARPVIIDQSTVSENIAHGWFGGGIGVADSGMLLLTNSTVAFNQGDSAGGGVGVFNKGRFDAVHATIAFNTVKLLNSGQGAGIHVPRNGSATLVNSIVAHNLKGMPDVYGELSIGHSLIGSVDPETVTALSSDSKGNLLGTLENVLDTRLERVLADHGGRIPTFALRPDSPAIDAGVALDGFSQSQNGILRLRPDLGAFEAPNRALVLNSRPTLLPIPSIVLDHAAGKQTILLTGISDGDATIEQALSITATSSNAAVVSEIAIVSHEDGTASLSFAPVAGTAGEANILVAVRDPGEDRRFGTVDDLKVSESLSITVVNPLADLPLLNVTDAVVLEPRIGKTPIEFELALSRPSTSVVTVRVRTVNLENGAKSPDDFAEVDQIVSFVPGEQFQKVQVQVHADSNLETLERFELLLEGPQGTKLVRNSVAGTIIDSPIIIGNPLLPELEEEIEESSVIEVLVNIHVTPEAGTFDPDYIPGLDDTVLVIVLGDLLDSLSPLDTNRDGDITPRDALRIINRLQPSSTAFHPIPADLLSTEDVDGDGFIAPLDALAVINALNRKPTNRTASGESEFMDIEVAFEDEEYQRKRRLANRGP